MRIGFRAHEPTRDFVFGFGIFNADGVCCYGTNTNLEELEPDRLSGEGEVRFVIDRLDLVEGTYKFDVAVHKLDGYPLRLPPPALHDSREGAAEGRRHLSPAAPLGVHRRRHVQARRARASNGG